MTQAGRDKWGRLISRTWADPAFKERLLSDPAAVLAEHGINTRGTVQVHQNDEETTHVAIPIRPSDLSDDDLLGDDPHPDICCHDD